MNFFEIQIAYILQHKPSESCILMMQCKEFNEATTQQEVNLCPAQLISESTQNALTVQAFKR